MHHTVVHNPPYSELAHDFKLFTQNNSLGSQLFRAIRVGLWSVQKGIEDEGIICQLPKQMAHQHALYSLVTPLTYGAALSSTITPG